jgi:hypothetical protein
MLNNNIEATDKPLRLFEQLWRVKGQLVNSKNEVVFETMPSIWTTAYEGQAAPVGSVVQLSKSRYYLVKS